MSVFGDAEPEDSWDRGDPIPVQIYNLLRRAELADGNVAPSLTDQLDGVERRMHARQRSQNIDERTRLRVQQILDDIEFVRSRLG